MWIGERSRATGIERCNIIVKVDGLPVELQIRTELQDLWAQIMERLADRVGREIRYGHLPENPDQRDVITHLIDLSVSRIADCERYRSEVAQIHGRLQSLSAKATADALFPEVVDQAEELKEDALRDEQIIKSTLEEALAIIKGGPQEAGAK